MCDYNFATYSLAVVRFQNDRIYNQLKHCMESCLYYESILRNMDECINVGLNSFESSYYSIFPFNNPSKKIL